MIDYAVAPDARIPGDFERNGQGRPLIAPVGGGRKKRAKRGEPTPTFYRLVEVETDDCVIWPFSGTSRGYGMVNIDGAKHYTHRLALEIRVGPAPAPKMHAAHGPCHDTSCMNYRHLRWATVAENLADRRRDGTDDVGTKNAMAKLTAQDVIDIRACTDKQTAIALRYGVCVDVISRVKRGITYRDVAA